MTTEWIVFLVLVIAVAALSLYLARESSHAQPSLKTWEEIIPAETTDDRLGNLSAPSGMSKRRVLFDSRDIAAYIAQQCVERKISYNNTKIQTLLYCVYGVMLA